MKARLVLTLGVFSKFQEYSTPTKSKPKNSESSTYYYERAEKELPTINNTARTYNYESNIAPGTLN